MAGMMMAAMRGGSVHGNGDADGGEDDEHR